MKKIIQLEEVAQMLLGFAALYYLPLSFSWWMWILLFLAPDIGMVGYVINTSIGAFTYNIFHHKAVAIVLILAGWFLVNIPLQVAGWLVFSHSSFDRMLGYGLKYSTSFHETHLGMIGNNAKMKTSQGELYQEK